MSENQLSRMRRMTEQELKHRIAEHIYARDYFSDTFDSLVDELMRRH